jgi:hypothetical protein
MQQHGRVAYSPIRESDIRLFTIQPKNQDTVLPQILTLHLDTFPGPNYPPYVALSYEWGYETDGQQVVSINSRALPIRKNLHEFLLHLRNLSGASDLSQNNGDDPVLFWADAISINQTDEVEKGEQVQRMDDIYESAARVLAWVWGPKGPSSPPRAQFNPEIIAYNSAAFLALQRWTPEANPQERFLRPDDERHLVDLRQLLVLPTYWTRRWIIQELVLPRQVTLIFGTVHIPFGHVEALFKAMHSFRAAMEDHRYHKQLRSRWKTTARTLERYKEERQYYEVEVLKSDFYKCPLAKICEYRTARGSWGDSSLPRAERTRWNIAIRQLVDFRLYEGLQHFVNFDCGHPLDIVYAIMGLIRPGDQLNVEYSLAPIELIKAIYRNMTTRRPWRALRPQSAFLYARFLTRKMYKDLDAELNSCLGDLSSSVPNPPLGIDLVVRRCYFVDSHLSSIKELLEAIDDRKLIRYVGGDKPLPPLRPVQFIRQPEYQHPSLSISPESTSVHGVNETDETDETNETNETDADDTVPAELESTLDQEAGTLTLPDITQALDSGDYRQSYIRQDLDVAMRDGFWDQPSRGPMFWERRLRRQRRGVYDLMPGSATPKIRDKSWHTNLEHRFFVAHSLQSVLGRCKIYGISEFPIEQGDEIWQIPGMEMALVLRNDGKEYCVVSRAYLYDNWYTTHKDNRLRGFLLLAEKLTKDEVTGESLSWNCLKPNTAVGEKKVIRLDLPLLLELSR